MQSSPLYPWTLAAVAAAAQPDFDCVLEPEEIAAMASQKHGEAVKVGQAAAQGEFEKLTVKQLQKLAQSNGISIARTKSEFIKFLKPLEPEANLESLKGPQLDVLIKKHKIGALRSKDELVSLLKTLFEKQATQDTAVQLAVEQAAALKSKITDGLQGLQGLKPQDFSTALVKFENLKSDLTAAKSLLPESEWSAFQSQLDYARGSFTSSIKSLGGKDLKEIAKTGKLKHYQWAGKDDLITLMTSDNQASIQAAKDNIEAKWSVWAEKHGGKPAKPTAPQSVKPATPKPVTAPPPPPPMPLPPAVVTDVDQGWQQFSESNPFKFQGKADIDGAHTKYFFTDAKNEKWLFKPVAEEFRGYGDEVAYKIGRLIDPDAIDVRFTQLEVPGQGRKAGSIQKWRTDLMKDFDFRDILPEKLTPHELEQLQREHVIDWLLSNHDAHGKQFLRLKDGRVLGIDKGQVFKFLGDDSLSLEYHPNQGFGFGEPYYNTVMRAWRDKKIELNLQSTYRTIREVEKITDDTYREILRPYAEGRFAGKPLKLKQFYETAFARKNNIRRDFEGFYTDLLRVRTGDKSATFTFDTGVNPVPGNRVGKWERIPEGREHLMEEARLAGWQGKSLPIDAADIEDQNILLYTEEVKKKNRTVMRMKIRPESEKKLLSLLSTGPNDTIGQAAGKALADDLFYDDILNAVKTVNHHLTKGDSNFSRQKIDKALKHRMSLRRLAEKGDAELKAMAQAYLKVLDDLDRVISLPNKAKIPVFERYVRVEAPVKPSGDRLAAVKRTTVHGDKKQIVGGKITVQSEEVSFGQVHSTFSSSGLEYKIDLGDGVEGIYRPWIKENYYAHQGQLEIRVMKDCTPETANQLLAKLERLGVDATFASSEQAELMYLSKQAYILKEDSSLAWKKLMQRLDHDKANPSERVNALRGFWSDKLGVADVTKMPGYDPEGKYSIMASGWKDKREAGWRSQLRFDISDEQINRDLKGYGLYHQVTGRGSLPEVLESALTNNGAMVSTVEKVRIGVPVGGMSPNADMESGGASYFFTRIRKLPSTSSSSSTGFYFKPTLLRRMDAITYDCDKYGRVTEDHVRKFRRSTLDDFKKLGSGNHSDETIFKNSVTILDNLDMVAVQSETERTKVLDIFRRHGVTQLPDGRRIETVVVMSR